MLVEPIKSRSDAELLRANSTLYDTLETSGHAKQLNTVDNGASTALKKRKQYSNSHHQTPT